MGTGNTGKVRAIITGSTGMVGEGVLHECLLSPDVEAVLVVNRSPCGVEHPKLKEVILKDFFAFNTIAAQVTGYNACYFCLGISSVGVSKDDYYKMTYTLTMGVAQVLSRVNPGMVFCYVSGAGTNINGSQNWSRVKGKTEHDLMALPFKRVYAFRPGYMHPTPGLKRVQKFYKYITWLYPIVRPFFPNVVSTLAQVGKAMINVTTTGYDKQVLESRDIVRISGF